MYVGVAGVVVGSDSWWMYGPVWCVRCVDRSVHNLF